MTHREQFLLKTQGETDVCDITLQLRAAVERSNVVSGALLVFVPGSTAGITTLEYEPGCVADLKAALERIAPRHGHYEHNERWGDGNGFSHVRAALLGPSLSIPIHDSELGLGTWQQVVLVDFDNGPRERIIVISIA